MNQIDGLSRVAVLGTGSAVPPGRLSNKDLEAMVETSNEWITERTGMEVRSVSTENEPLPVLGAVAATAALRSAGVERPSYIIFGNHKTGTYSVPDNAAIVAELIGVKCPAHDMSGGCSGGLIAEDIAANKLYGLLMQQLMRGEDISEVLKTTVLVLAGDTLTHVLDYKDRGTCILLSDGVGAALYGFTTNSTAIQEKHGYLGSYLMSDGALGRLLWWASGAGPQFDENLKYIGNAGTVDHPRHRGQKDFRPRFHMNGNEVFRHAVRKMTGAAEMLIQQLGIDQESEEYKTMLVIPHQANGRIVQAVIEKLGLPADNVWQLGVARYANNSLGTYMIAQDEMHTEGRLDKGRLLLKNAFGGGLTWGANLNRWALNPPTADLVMAIDEKLELMKEYYAKYKEWEARMCE
ncbi:hypothetical protein JW868_03160 [Candidatus Woesearchaeota archaeon]|nr:hypothetical protein [Candidatus Woesearchaeota archaeon]